MNRDRSPASTDSDGPAAVAPPRGVAGSRERLAVLAELATALARELDERAVGALTAGAARRLTGAAYATLVIRLAGSEPSIYAPLASAGAPPSDPAAGAGVAHPELDALFAALLAGDQPWTSADARADAAGRGLSPHPGVGSYIAHPLLDPDGGVLGVLLAGDPAAHSFTGEDIEALRLLGAQAAAAVHTARLYAGVQQALRDSETLRFIGQQLAGQVDVDAILNQLVRHARAILRADLAAVATVDGANQTTWVARVGFNGDGWMRTHDYPNVSAAGQIVAARAPQIFDVGERPEQYPVLAGEGVVDAFGVPLLRGAAAFGALMVGYRAPSQIAAHEIALAQALASHASVSIENARLLAEAQARAAEAERERRLLAAVLDSLPTGLAIADPAGDLLRVNGMGLLLAGAADDAPPARPLDLRRPDGTPMPADEQPLRRALHAGEAVVGVQAALAGGDGSLTPLIVNAGPVRLADGTLTGAVMAFQDVSHLVEVQRLKDEFLSVASHELKTPLTPLMGLTQMMLRALERGRAMPPEQIAQHLRSIHRQGQHMSELVNDLLDVSRIRLGHLELHRRPADLVALAGEVLDRFRTLDAGERHDRLRLHAAVPTLTGSVDSARIDQVITNLVANALKYSPPDQDVIVGVEPSGDGARITVQDRGIGIPKAEQDQLFQPFSRASNASVRNYPGVGLGLHITREIVERHGGTIAVDSDEGQGSTFIVSLPLAETMNAER